MLKSLVMRDHGLIRTLSYRIRLINEQLYTIETNKKALTAFCDKRYDIESIQLLPYGYKANREKAVYQEIAPDENVVKTGNKDRIEQGTKLTRMPHLNYQMEQWFSKMKNLFSHLLIWVSINRPATQEVK